MGATLNFVFGSVLVLLILVNDSQAASELEQDMQSLLSFLSQVPHSSRLQWNVSVAVCSWVGVGCDDNQAFVTDLRLPAVGLLGSIPPNTLGQLSHLRVLSLRSNRLSGEMPLDFANLTSLRNLYLQDNKFDGGFPLPVTQLRRITRLDLSSNNFSGSIPFSVNNLTHLTRLFLQKNRFSGNLPSLDPGRPKDFNVSYNNLNGSVPTALSGYFRSSFVGNQDLCGRPLPACNSFLPDQALSPPSSWGNPNRPHNDSARLSTTAIVLTSVGCAVVALAFLLFLLLCLRRTHKRQPSKYGKQAITSRTSTVEVGTSSSKDDVTGGSAEREKNKLVFFEGGICSFDLEDLLRASAEVLGKGSVGTSYKAVLEEGITVVVKRLKDVTVGKREFETHMDVLGKIRHENILPLRAYYYSKDEKLLVYDFMAVGSLSTLLHGSRGSGRAFLDWESRKKIALAAARGVVHLQAHCNVTHGNIKPSNILLRRGHDACVSDLGLNSLCESWAATGSRHRIAGGYQAPEVAETHKVTFKSDVYSFGVMLLEILTGKAPNQGSLGEEGVDLPRWVQSVVREEWTAEVFDVVLMTTYHNIEEEMVQLLQIAMACVSIVPDQRPRMEQVMKMIEDMNRTAGCISDDGNPSRESDTPQPQVPTTASQRTPPGASENE